MQHVIILLISVAVCTAWIPPSLQVNAFYMLPLKRKLAAALPPDFATSETQS